MADFSRADLVAIIAGQLVAQRSNYSQHSIAEAVGAAVEIVDAAESAWTQRHLPHR
jgi:hypothetical protein